MLNNQGRPTQAGEAHGVARETFTGNHALEIDEALIFDQGGVIESANEAALALEFLQQSFVVDIKAQ